MKRFLIAILLTGSFLSSQARHITGGEIIYTYLGDGAGTKRYSITLKLFRDNNGGGADLPPNVVLGIYNNLTRQRFSYENVVRNSLAPVPTNPLPNCMTNAPTLDYSVAYYTISEIELPITAQGYTIAYQTCCRITTLENVVSTNEIRTGATYMASIPGGVTAGNDSSPRFAEGLDVVCHNRPFSLDFSATDPDNDILRYSLCGAYDGGGANSSTQPSLYETPAGPPYDIVPYQSSLGYSGLFPMGTGATINPNTGIITGIAPPAGSYVVSVCITVLDRNTGLVKGSHRKDFVINVAPCDIAGAQLLPHYISCDGFTFTFNNLNNSPLNETYFWDFGDGNTSTEVDPVHTYTTAGVYDIKLVVNRGNPCADSATSKLSVFPGFFPGFTTTAPTCKGVPVQFRDITVANYGVLDYWKWDFGVPGEADTSRLQHPTFVYNTPGTYRVTLFVKSSVGCEGFVFTDDVQILEQAPYTVTNDTLICNVDTLQLIFTTPNPGIITWSPNYMISDVNSYTPLVSPDVTTKYYFNYSDNFGCTARDSVLVRVVDHVTLNVLGDTSICRTDAVTLTTSGDGLSFTWTPALTLNDPTLPSPVATPTATSTTYRVESRIGKCMTPGQVTLTTVPYPVANAGPDDTICFGESYQLRASGGSIYSWSPRLFLNNSNIANPISQIPQRNMEYIVTVRDVLGCPKPVNDTMFLTVAKIIADAGPADTNVVLGQPLLLNATGSTNYEWTPSTWLNNLAIFNPVSLPQESIQYVVRVSNAQGCFDTDTINVKLFKIDPDLLVPTAFSPDNDGVNDVFRPIVIGMKSLDAFRVYNRWGQLMFSTTQVNNGWDGKFKGAPQSAGTYVWLAEGITYLGRKVEKKGSVILIR